MTLESIFEKFKNKGKIRSYKIISEDFSNLEAEFEYEGIENLKLKTLQPNEQDFQAASSFYKNLSSESRSFFGPPDRFLPPSKEADKNFMLGGFPNYSFVNSKGVIIAIFFLRKFWERLEERPDLNTAELGIGVLDSYQGKGLGSLAMDILEEVAHKRNLNGIWLINFNQNEKAENLYKHKNYKEIKKFTKINLVTGIEAPVIKRLKIFEE